ncbi:hypothetical protein QQP08_010662 [Theobroma cacao]|nr:hypothetical protein QQP08_010662 [Theobroma cacao]
MAIPSTFMVGDKIFHILETGKSTSHSELQSQIWLLRINQNACFTGDPGDWNPIVRRKRIQAPAPTDIHARAAAALLESSLRIGGTDGIAGGISAGGTDLKNFVAFEPFLPKSS